MMNKYEKECLLALRIWPDHLLIKIKYYIEKIKNNYILIANSLVD